ncbi:hypothetical protein FNV43_RR00342 [Rhamnella rubrinervis]|uniref:Uncharacterized protein n=1 Tax=Rhamnella rubrinervis TaxID=2594499 RepID=A0A8K0HQ66_9ROSA|nr:hypothetical protein FNV43_RR00342 [Rhamnella rubrinervis]
MVGKFVCSRDEVSDIESRYEPPKKVSRDDPIMVSDSEEVDKEDESEDNKHKWDVALIDALPFEKGESLLAWFTNEEDYKKEREEMLKYDEVVRRKIMKELEEEDFDPLWCSLFDTKLQSTKKRLKGDPEDMDFEMSYARVNDKNYRDSNVDEDEDPETPPHYHIDEFHSDSSSEN